MQLRSCYASRAGTLYVPFLDEDFAVYAQGARGPGRASILETVICRTVGDEAAVARVKKVRFLLPRKKSAAQFQHMLRLPQSCDDVYSRLAPAVDIRPACEPCFWKHSHSSLRSRRKYLLAPSAKNPASSSSAATIELKVFDLFRPPGRQGFFSNVSATGPPTGPPKKKQKNIHKHTSKRDKTSDLSQKNREVGDTKEPVRQQESFSGGEDPKDEFYLEFKFHFGDGAVFILGDDHKNLLIQQPAIY